MFYVGSLKSIKVEKKMCVNYSLRFFAEIEIKNRTKSQEEVLETRPSWKRLAMFGRRRGKEFVFDTINDCKSEQISLDSK